MPSGSPNVRPIGIPDRDAWLRLRSELWPEDPRDRLAEESDDYLAGRGLASSAGRPVPSQVLAAFDGLGGMLGFVEATLRPVADGCGPGPIGYLEGWFVVPSARRAGIGRALVAAAEAWAIAKGCVEMASDVTLGNASGEAAHRGLGYEEVDRAIRYRRALRAPPADPATPVGRSR